MAQPFPNAYQGCSEGLRGGVAMGSNLMQIVLQKAKMQHDQDAETIKTGLEMVKAMPTPEAKRKVMNGLAPTMKKLGFDIGTFDEWPDAGDQIIRSVSSILNNPKFNDRDKKAGINMLRLGKKLESNEEKGLENILTGLDESIRNDEFYGKPGTQGLPYETFPVAAKPQGVRQLGLSGLGQETDRFNLEGNAGQSLKMGFPRQEAAPGLVSTMEGQPPEYIAAQGINYRNTGKIEMPKGDKDLNIPADIDSFGISEFGGMYLTPEGRKMALSYMSTPKGKEAFIAWKQKTALPLYAFPATAEGFVPANMRTGVMGVPTGQAKPLTGEMIVTQQQIGTLKDVFGRVKKLYKPEYVGALQGRAGAVRSVTIGNPEDRATFYSGLQDINNTLIYLKSGKQINEQEYERLKSAMPHKNLADSDFSARMTEFEKVLDSIGKERQKGMGGYGGKGTIPPPAKTEFSIGPYNVKVKGK